MVISPLAAALYKWFDIQTLPLSYYHVVWSLLILKIVNAGFSIRLWKKVIQKFCNSVTNMKNVSWSTVFRSIAIIVKKKSWKSVVLEKLCKPWKLGTVIVDVNYCQLLSLLVTFCFRFTYWLHVLSDWYNGTISTRTEEIAYFSKSIFHFVVVVAVAVALFDRRDLLCKFYAKSLSCNWLTHFFN